MCPPYTEEFIPAPTHRPKVREKRYINRVVKGQCLAMNHALFLPWTLEQVRSVTHDPNQRQYLEMDLRLLTGETEIDVRDYVDRMLELYERMPFSMTEQISEGELHRVIDEMSCGFSPKMASTALWGMDVYVSDHDRPFDQLSWGLHYLQRWDYLPVAPPQTRLTSENGSQTLLIHLLEGLADRVLITQGGSHHHARLAQLKSWPAVEHVVLEEDSHGPLRCGLITNKGTLCYG